VVRWRTGRYALSIYGKVEDQGFRYRMASSQHPSLNQHNYVKILEHINIEVLNQINYSYNKQSYPGKH
jgi:hypothetical protein